jgi:hypothetical protein
MKCPTCGNFFNPDQQVPVCPHELLNRFEPSPRLLSEKQRQMMDEAFHAKDVDALRQRRGSPNPAARIQFTRTSYPLYIDYTSAACTPLFGLNQERFRSAWNDRPITSAASSTTPSRSLGLG